MTNDRTGPPDGEGRPSPGPADVEEAVATPPITNTAKITAQPRQCAADALRRRRLASYRCEQLESGHRDPWQPPRPARLSPVQVEAAAIAAAHLLELGMAPRFDIATLRQLWQAGHHALVNELRGEVAA